MSDKELPAGLQSSKGFYQEKDGFILMDRKQFLIYLDENPIEREVRWIQNHHTWRPNYSHWPEDHFKRANSIKSSHLKRGFSDSGQNILTFPDGKIMICRPLEKTPAGIKGKNKFGICIEHYGDFDIGSDDMKDEQRITIIFLNAALCIHKALVPSLDSIIYHTWFAGYKSCPGTNFFGGNTTEDAYNNFIPKIKDSVDRLLNVM